jgi:hypothetical protein
MLEAGSAARSPDCFDRAEIQVGDIDEQLGR